MRALHHRRSSSQVAAIDLAYCRAIVSAIDIAYRPIVSAVVSVTPAFMVLFLPVEMRGQYFWY